MTQMQVRDVSLFVDVVGRGDPLLLMHGWCRVGGRARRRRHRARYDHDS